MNKLKFISWLVVVMLVLVGCSPTVTPTPDPIVIVQGYYAALNAKQLEAVMAYFADNAVLSDTTGKFYGKDAIRATLQAAINNNVTMNTNNYHATAGRVVFDYQVSVNGAVVFADTGLIIINVGQIVFEGSEASWTEECDRDASQAFCAK